jgi:hypothetical protein
MVRVRGPSNLERTSAARSLVRFGSGADFGSSSRSDWRLQDQVATTNASTSMRGWPLVARFTIFSVWVPTVLKDCCHTMTAFCLGS